MILVLPRPSSFPQTGLANEDRRELENKDFLDGAPVFGLRVLDPVDLDS